MWGGTAGFFERANEVLRSVQAGNFLTGFAFFAFQEGHCTVKFMT
jgi:hypothetical protein